MPLCAAATELRVRYGETDAMGWVYYGTYLLYFEVGRTELMRSAWTSYRSLEERGMRLPVVEAACRYHFGARYDDLLRIDTELFIPSPVRLRFHYRISRATDARLIASGHTEHCFVGESGKPIRIPHALLDRFGK
jgi:acyl-CoA thioester hydrolase